MSKHGNDSTVDEDTIASADADTEKADEPTEIAEEPSAGSQDREVRDARQMGANRRLRRVARPCADTCDGGRIPQVARQFGA